MTDMYNAFDAEDDAARKKIGEAKELHESAYAKYVAEHEYTPTILTYYDPTPPYKSWHYNTFCAGYYGLDFVIEHSPKYYSDAKDWPEELNETLGGLAGDLYYDLGRTHYCEWEPFWAGWCARRRHYEERNLWPAPSGYAPMPWSEWRALAAAQQ